MIVCIEKNPKKAAIMIKSLNEEYPEANFTFDKKTGEITETKLKGEELFNKFGHKLLWKRDEITVFLKGREHIVCKKEGNWYSDPTFDHYNTRIKSAFWQFYKEGLII